MRQTSVPPDEERPDSEDARKTRILLLRCAHFGWIEARDDLAADRNFCLTGDCRGVDEALRKLSAVQVDAIIASATIPNLSPAELVRRLRAASPDSRIILLGDAIHQDMVRALWHEGMSAYLPWRDVTAESLCFIAESVAQAPVDLCITTRPMLVETPPLSPGQPDVHISDRDRAILRGLCAGLTLEPIAKQVGISMRTVSSVITRLETKLGVPNRCALVIKAREKGLDL
ncbi:MAG: LuxR C-terminal-related transcriptional regulator [Chloroflexota bacterium]